MAELRLWYFASGHAGRPEGGCSGTDWAGKCVVAPKGCKPPPGPFCGDIQQQCDFEAEMAR